MNKDGFYFDFETQRFLVNRWETELGKKVRDDIIKGIKDSDDLRWILDDYVLNTNDNFVPYSYPIYPKDKMKEEAFWVLTQDDLRGIHLYNEDFSDSKSLGKKQLTYSMFYNCNLSNVNMDRADISGSRIEKCNLANAYLSNAGGYNVKIIDSNLNSALMYNSGFLDCDFSGTNLTNAYFEDTLFENIKVNYLTKFDYKIRENWEHRDIKKNKIADILRAIRISYEKAELWDEADKYMHEEKKSFRKYILWERFRKYKTTINFSKWLKSIISGGFSGYSTMPHRIIYTAIVISILYAVIYKINGSFIKETNFLEAIYFSFTTFATLGYGDISFPPNQPYMRILSTSEAWVGAIVISLFVTTLAKKLLR